MLQRIKHVLSRGYQLRDICVLGRNNRDLARWAKFLIKNGLEVTTDEGLAVSYSLKVKFVVSWMQLISKPGSSQNQRDFALNYLLLNKSDQQQDFLPFFKSKYFDYQPFLDAFFKGEQIHQMRYENLYDLVLKILRHQEIDELSDPFLHFFCNLVQGFDIAQGPNLDKFLQYYNTRGKDKRVSLAEGNAIRLMTAHKSKGLEFPVVIMPQTKWDWSVRGSMNLFHDAQREVFYLASISKSDATQLQVALYEEEIAKNKLDAFNLFYVACTRAVDELHIREAGSKYEIGQHIKGADAATLYKEAVTAGQANRVVFGANMQRNEYGPQQFAQFFFFITGFHGFHVFSGVVINIIIFLGVLRGVYHTRGHYEMVEKTGLYWHFVDLVWVFVFTFFYLV
jgi:ATP-dependent exoDNAse (exonuclease V) beta subunit